MSEERSQLAHGYTGAVIQGKYRVEGVIGRGGMGAVYAAQHLGLDERVAVKFLAGPSAFLPDARESFRREVAALVRLRHPGVVSILDAGEFEGEPYMVMEMLHGRTLSQVVAQNQNRLPLARAVAIFDQILEVLEATHKVGIVHRDLKPDNVILLDQADRPDRVKVFDFGIAQLTQADTAAGASSGIIIGTPAYMAPEQCRGLPASTATDIYAAGVMLFDCLAGDLPFTAEDPAELLAQHVMAPIPSVADRGVRQAVPHGLDMMITAMLAKDPHARPSATRVREALADAVSSQRARASGSIDDAPSRLDHASLDREDRAPTLPRGLVPVAAPPSIEGHAFIWHPDLRRAADLAGMLGAGGLPGVPWPDDSLPNELPGAGTLRIVLLSEGSASAERIARLRAHPLFRAAPLLIFDVARSDGMASLIRAGASDVALRAAGDDEIAKKAARIARRGR
jgi:serine/threonine-protein kinase